MVTRLMISARAFPPVIARRARGMLACLCLLTSACAQFPQIDAFPAGGSDQIPSLVPIDPLIAQAQASSGTAAAAGEALAARAARLKARAALMRGPVHDPQTRSRLTAAIASGRA